MAQTKNSSAILGQALSDALMEQAMLLVEPAFEKFLEDVADKCKIDLYDVDYGAAAAAVKKQLATSFDKLVAKRLNMGILTIACEYNRVLWDEEDD